MSLQFPILTSLILSIASLAHAQNSQPGPPDEDGPNPIYVPRSNDPSVAHRDFIKHFTGDLQPAPTSVLSIQPRTGSDDWNILYHADRRHCEQSQTISENTDIASSVYLPNYSVWTALLNPSNSLISNVKIELLAGFSRNDIGDTYFVATNTTFSNQINGQARNFSALQILGTTDSAAERDLWFAQWFGTLESEGIIGLAGLNVAVSPEDFVGPVDPSRYSVRRAPPELPPAQNSAGFFFDDLPGLYVLQFVNNWFAADQYCQTGEVSWECRVVQVGGISSWVFGWLDFQHQCTPFKVPGPPAGFLGDKECNRLTVTITLHNGLGWHGFGIVDIVTDYVTLTNESCVGCLD